MAANLVSHPKTASPSRNPGELLPTMLKYFLFYMINVVRAIIHIRSVKGNARQQRHIILARCAMPCTGLGFAARRRTIPTTDIVFDSHNAGRHNLTLARRRTQAIWIRYHLCQGVRRSTSMIIIVPKAYLCTMHLCAGNSTREKSTPMWMRSAQCRSS